MYKFSILRLLTATFCCRRFLFGLQLINPVFLLIEAYVCYQELLHTMEQHLVLYIYFFNTTLCKPVVTVIPPSTSLQQ